MIEKRYWYLILAIVIVFSVFVFKMEVSKNEYNLSKDRASQPPTEDKITAETAAGSGTTTQGNSGTESSSSNVDVPIGSAITQDDILRHVVLVKCGNGFSSRSGSGVIQVSGESTTRNWDVYTNAHVTGDNERCTVYVPTEPDYYPSISVPATVTHVSSDYPDIDFAILSVQSALPFADFPYDACVGAENEIGDSVRVYGYPSSGGSTLTVTEGIISGSTYTSFGPIFKTSAKIDKGNSGGIAVNMIKGCTVGIPTWAVAGEIEGLGYIQSWDMIYKAGDL